MPTFGEYETVGDPIATAEERNHTSTVWRAVKPGASDGREYMVKCYAPRRSSRSPETESLSRDRGLEFLEGIKEQKRAQSSGGRSLAPIHEFGISDAGAWYVTDYFPRSNLKAWITKKGRVDSAGLRHVVAELVTGCLALKHSRGYSHGNLKVSNIFRAGKTGTFHQSPILLTDPYPAGPARELDAENTALLGNLMEGEDLRAIGEVLLQLVEGRLLANSEDYNWPIALTPAWKNLGKDGERWLQLCNQLLDGNRSPEALNLESLAQEFRPRAGRGKMVLAMAAAVVALGVLGGGIYLIASGSAKRKQEKFNADVQAARQAHSLTNLTEALAQVNAALARQPDNPDAAALKGEIETAVEREFVAAIQSAEAKLVAYTPESLLAAEQFLKSAEALKRQDQRVSDLRGRIAGLRQNLETEARRKVWVDALAAYLKQGDTEAQAGAPNWLQASNYYALAVTNAALLNDAANRQLAERGLARAVSAIEAQSGEERLRNEIQRLQSQAREAGRTNNWPEAVALLTRAQSQSKGLTNNPIVVDAELAAAKRSLSDWQNQEAERKAISALIVQGTAGANAANWLSASNFFARALTNAVQIRDAQLQQSARTNLQIAIQKLEEQERLRVANQRQQAEALALKQATAALEAGDFSRARELSRQFSGPQVAQLAQRINSEEALWKQLNDHLTKAQYADVINAPNLPNTPLFTGLKTAAEQEQRVLQEADREFKLGTTTSAFRFLSASEFTSRTNKPVFLSLAREAREELQQGQRAEDLMRQTNLTGVRQYLSTELRDKTNKEPFKNLIARLDALDAQFQQTEAAFAKLVADGETLFNNKDFTRARAKGNEALAGFPSVRDRSAATDLVNRAAFQLERAEDLTSASRALAAGGYATVAKLQVKYPTDAEFIAIANQANEESKALKSYEGNFAGGDYRFISDLESQTDYNTKPPFADLLRDAKAEAMLFAEFQKLQSATNWLELLNQFNTIAAAPAASKPRFTEMRSWADALKKAEEGRQVSQLQALDTQLEKLLVNFNVLRARVTESAKRESILGAIGNGRATYSAAANALESRYPASWLDQAEWRDGKSRRSLLAELKRSIANWP